MALLSPDSLFHLLFPESGSDEGREEEEESEQTEGATFTVEEAVEKIGFGWFQIKLFLVCGLFSVSFLVG